MSQTTLLSKSSISTLQKREHLIVQKSVINKRETKITMNYQYISTEITKIRKIKTKY